MFVMIEWFMSTVNDLLNDFLRLSADFWKDWLSFRDSAAF